jgi:hypothetical protein
MQFFNRIERENQPPVKQSSRESSHASSTKPSSNQTGSSGNSSSGSRSKHHHSSKTSSSKSSSLSKFQPTSYYTNYANAKQEIDYSSYLYSDSSNELYEKNNAANQQPQSQASQKQSSQRSQSNSAVPVVANSSKLLTSAGSVPPSTANASSSSSKQQQPVAVAANAFGNILSVVSRSQSLDKHRNGDESRNRSSSMAPKQTRQQPTVAAALTSGVSSIFNDSPIYTEQRRSRADLSARTTSREPVTVVDTTSTIQPQQQQSQQQRTPIAVVNRTQSRAQQVGTQPTLLTQPQVSLNFYLNQLMKRSNYSS